MARYVFVCNIQRADTLFCLNFVLFNLRLPNVVFNTFYVCVCGGWKALHCTFGKAKQSKSKRQILKGNKIIAHIIKQTDDECEKIRGEIEVAPAIEQQHFHSCVLSFARFSLRLCLHPNRSFIQRLHCSTHNTPILIEILIK